MPEKMTSLNGLKVTLEYGSYSPVKAKFRCPGQCKVKMSVIFKMISSALFNIMQYLILIHIFRGLINIQANLEYELCLVPLLINLSYSYYPDVLL